MVYCKHFLKGVQSRSGSRSRHCVSRNPPSSHDFFIFDKITLFHFKIFLQLNQTVIEMYLLMPLFSVFPYR